MSNINMPIVIDSIEQGSEQWFQEKLGKPSASNASKIITNDGKPSKQAKMYLYELAAQAVTGQMEESYKSLNMLIGEERESESRAYYELINDVKVKKVGVIYKDKKKEFLCSPDGIIEDKYGLELKNVLPKTQVKYLLDGSLPSEYFSQIQFSLYVTGFEYWDFMSYSPGLKPLIVRVKRDEKFLELLEKELIKFCEDLKTTIKRIGD